MDATAEHGPIGPLEEQYRRSAAFRDVSQGDTVTRTHWHIAIANGLGWGFDGMDGVIFALASPLIIKDFGLTVPEYRSGLQIALLIGIAGMYVWPWLADRYGRRTLLAINIAMFSLLMPVVALCYSWPWFVALRAATNFALNGEWSLGSLLVAETWPARLRGRVIGINRGTWCFGAALAGAIATGIIAVYGWRIAVAVPAVVAVIGVYVRAQCPESPYWVRLQDRKRRIAETLARGQMLSPADREWANKAKTRQIKQLFLPDMRKNTAIATFIACCSTTIYGTVGGWMPLYLSQERHWATATYGKFYIAWGLVGFLGLLASGWIADKWGRRPAFYVMLAQGSIFITLWVFATTDLELWIYGLLWSIGFLGFWGPSMVLTAEIFPTRVRGAGNGFAWSIAWLFGFVLWPFVAVGLQQYTGSFAAAFLLIPVAMAFMALGVWWFTPDYAGQELDQISF